MVDASKDTQVRSFFTPDVKQICVAEAPVSQWTIRAWCRAMGDDNPVYQDEAEAIRYGHGGIFAPPVLMHGYTLPGLIDETQDNMQLALRRRFGELGINSVVAVNYDQEYVTPIRIGDVLTRTVRYESISDEKHTALGVGHFVVMDERIVNQDGGLIGTQKVKTLFYRPAERVTPRDKPAPKAADAVQGIALPPLEIPLTTTLIIACAIATNDFEKVHHDRDEAHRQGLQDIIMNILTSSGLAIRFVTDWAGPAARVKRISTRLLASNYPGDCMTLTGLADRPFESGTETTVHVRGENSIGTHVESRITIA